MEELRKLTKRESQNGSSIGSVLLQKELVELSIAQGSMQIRECAMRSAPLIAAIKGFEEQFGTPPPDLNALLPAFISSIPNTGMAAYPNYEYIVGKNAANYSGNPWVVTVQTSQGVLNWDQVVYYPLQNYPSKGLGGVLERVEDWAYVHE